MDHLSRCSCGWPLPRIGLCDLRGGLLPSTIVPVYDCPLCDATHLARELDDCDPLTREQVIAAFAAAKSSKRN